MSQEQDMSETKAALSLSLLSIRGTLAPATVDVWMNAAGMSEYYEDPAFRSGFQDLFAAPPSTSVWMYPAGEWVEW